MRSYPYLRCASVAALLAVCFVQLSQAQAPLPLERGLLVTYTSLAGPAKVIRDIVDAAQVRCYVGSNESPTPFLPPGKFNVAWHGYLSVDLRSEYYFQADVGGEFKLIINDQTVLEFKSDGGASPLSKPVRLKKGTNAITAVLLSPAKGDTFVRLHWTETETGIRPIPAAAFSRPAGLPALTLANQLRFGRELFLENRCGKCHVTPHLDQLPEGAMDAPTLEAIGARRGEDWMARWILDPESVRPTAHMPKLLYAATAAEDAAAIAAYLASLRDSATNAPETITAEQQTAGAQLFETLLCTACHTAPADPPSAEKISLAQVNAKFSPGALRAFLSEPQRHYRWIRMPNFKLSSTESAQIAAYLRGGAEKAPAGRGLADPAVRARGDLLVKTKGCMNCHQLNSQNQFAAITLQELTAPALTAGCLAEEPDPVSTAPRYSLAPEQRAALRIFLSTDRAALARHIPAEFATRQTRLLNCNACHGQHETFPPLDVIGVKLVPEWMKAFIAGEVTHKPRPWVAARMPAFSTHAEGLAAGLSTLNGFPARTPAAPVVDEAAARFGQKLIGKEGGFSCVSCHAVRSMKAMEVFESEGINLAYAAARLQYPYFRRWLLDPLLIDPQTKMPDYFDGWTSPLTDVYDGDAPKQVEAIWNYLRLGDKMPLPNGGQTQ